MNERIIETPNGNVLLYRDLIDGEHQVVMSAWLDEGTKISTSFDVASAEAARSGIADMSADFALRFTYSFKP